jgi:hypothetical protein
MIIEWQWLFAPLALKVPIIADANVVSKSYPDLGGYENFRYKVSEIISSYQRL